jgi:hypothetical protein
MSTIAGITNCATLLNTENDILPQFNVAKEMAEEN